jgi:NADH dehydrogenase FAD-containing subunit
VLAVLAAGVVGQVFHAHGVEEAEVALQPMREQAVVRRRLLREVELAAVE